jgi:hypothetical protein
VTLQTKPTAPAYKVDALIGLAPASGEKANNFTEHGKKSSFGFKFARADREIEELLKASQVKNWHNNMRDAIASMIGRDWSDFQIRLACAPYCKDGADDPDLAPLIDGGREKFDKPEVEIHSDGSRKPLDAEAIARNKRLADERERRLDDEADAHIDRMNKLHAVLPIGDKTAS